MRSWLFEFLAIVLIIGSCYFFYQCLQLLTDRDYVGAILTMFIGFAIIRVGSDMAKLSLWSSRE